MADIRKEWQDELHKADCRYFVLNAEDFLNSLSAEGARVFNNMLYDYNKSRGKVVQHFVVERHNYPMFETNAEFTAFLEKSYKDYKKKIDESNSNI